MYSVVIPVYNHDAYLVEAVLSAAQDRLVSEILLADDGSRDGSLTLIEAIAQRYPEKVRDCTLRPVANIGADATLNRLISMAGNDWIAVLNSDDKFVAGRFAAISQMRRVERFDFCFGNLGIIDERSRVIGLKRAFLDPQYPFPDARRVERRSADLLQRLVCQNYIATTSNMVFSKAHWQSVGGFRSYRYAHDWDFAIRSMLVGKALYIAEYLTLYRLHGSNTIKDSRQLQDAEVRSIFKTLDDDFGIFGTPDLADFVACNQYL